MNSECNGTRVNMEHGARHHLIGAIDGDRYDWQAKLFSKTKRSMLERMNVAVIGATPFRENNNRHSL